MPETKDRWGYLQEVPTPLGEAIDPKVVRLDKPSIGRQVHYVGLNKTHRPAFIVEVVGPDQERCDLFVIGSASTHHEFAVPHSEGRESATWHWPERE